MHIKVEAILYKKQTALYVPYTTLMLRLTTTVLVRIWKTTTKGIPLSRYLGRVCKIFGFKIKCVFTGHKLQPLKKWPT